MRLGAALSILLFLAGSNVLDAFTVNRAHAAVVSCRPTSSTCTALFAIDEGMLSRLDNIRRSYQALTERLGDPDVLENSKLLQKVMSDRAQSEEVVLVYEEYSGLQEELAGATELFQEAGDDNELKEMARAEIKEIEPQMEALEAKMKILLLPKDPNDDRNIMLEIRAGTGGSEANIFAGTYVWMHVCMYGCYCRKNTVLCYAMLYQLCGVKGSMYRFSSTCLFLSLFHFIIVIIIVIIIIVIIIIVIYHYYYQRRFVGCLSQVHYHHGLEGYHY
jgi:hypothetical protein